MATIFLMVVDFFDVYANIIRVTGTDVLPFWGNHTELYYTAVPELNYYDMGVSLLELCTVVILSLSGNAPPTARPQRCGVRTTAYARVAGGGSRGSPPPRIHPGASCAISGAVPLVDRLCVLSVRGGLRSVRQLDQRHLMRAVRVCVCDGARVRVRAVARRRRHRGRRRGAALAPFPRSAAVLHDRALRRAGGHPRVHARQGAGLPAQPKAQSRLSEENERAIGAASEAVSGRVRERGGAERLRRGVCKISLHDVAGGTVREEA